MTIHLTYDRAVKELQRAVTERGEKFVYPEAHRDGAGLCQYVNKGLPACIVGKVFSQFGLSLEALVGALVGPEEAGLRVGITMDPEARHLLELAQELQDKDYTWGEAFNTALTGECLPC